MQTKLFELRDRATFIPAIAVLLASEEPRERYLLRRAGYSPDDQVPLVLLTRLEGGKASYDCYDWDVEPWRTVHHWLENHWNEVESGAVLDGEFLRGETKVPKQSEEVEAQ